MHTKNSLRTMSNNNINKVLLVVATLFLNQRVNLVYGLKHTKESRLNQIQKHLDKINKPPVLTIESPDGDLIDCVHKKKQPAFDHPLLVNHKIQEIPPEMPKCFGGGRSHVKERAIMQTWHMNGTWCPKGTIPIRRSTPEDVLRAKSLFDYGRKPRRVDRDGRQGLPVANPITGHEHAFAYTNVLEDIYGASASINLWDPMVQHEKEFSLSQIWIESGSYNDSNLNTIEAGWQVYPSRYHDSKPRLFVYWTTDAYQKTGCYNLVCPGFVQTNDRIVPGASLITTLSTFQGAQYDLFFLIWKDRKSGHWWLGAGDNVIGYWPAKLFTRLKDKAETVQWGGEITNLRTGGRHTTTQMGSGRFAGEGFRRASYFRNLEIVGSNNTRNAALKIKTAATAPNCYNILRYVGNDWGSYFYYGGPGYNPKCP